MVNEREINLPPGFLAELVAASVLDGHLGAHNKGHDLVDAAGVKVEVKSCSRRGKDPEWLEIATRPSFPEGCDAVVLVSTSGAAVTAKSAVHMIDGELRASINVTATRPTDQIRAYRLDRKNFDRMVKHSATKDGGRVTWRVKTTSCQEIDLNGADAP